MAPQFDSEPWLGSSISSQPSESLIGLLCRTARVTASMTKSIASVKLGGLEIFKTSECCIIKTGRQRATDTDFSVSGLYQPHNTLARRERTILTSLALSNYQNSNPIQGCKCQPDQAGPGPYPPSKSTTQRMILPELDTLHLPRGCRHPDRSGSSLGQWIISAETGEPGKS